MPKKWIVLFVFVIGLVFAAGILEFFVFHFFVKPKVLTLPEELTTKFDPTVNTPVFVIEKIDAYNKVLEMKYVWPDKNAGIHVTSKIGCENNQIEIIYSAKSSSNKNTNVSVEKFFNELEKMKFGEVAFSGICSDKTCAVLKSSCRLYIINSTR
jgi:hypothetical protein